MAAHIIVTNRSWSVLYAKDRVFFPVNLWPKREEREPLINGEKRGSLSYSTDRENEVSKISIISLRLIGRAGKETS